MKRVLLITAGVVVVAVGLFVGLALGIGYWLAPQSQLSHSDAIVAISGGETDSRASEAIKLFQDGYADTLIFSGAAADTSGPSNAKAMERQALDAGIKPDHIIIDEVSANTSQNATAVARLIDQRHFQQIILVTSPYHQRRAYIEFKRAVSSGVKILNHSAIDHSWRRSDWWANPFSYRITIVELQKTLFLYLTNSK